MYRPIVMVIMIFMLINITMNIGWVAPFLILVVATDMEKNLKGVLFHFRFGFSVIIGRLSRLDAMITSLTSFPIGRIQVKLEPYQRLRRFLTCATNRGQGLIRAKTTGLRRQIRHCV